MSDLDVDAPRSDLEVRAERAQRVRDLLRAGFDSVRDLEALARAVETCGLETQRAMAQLTERLRSLLEGAFCEVSGVA